MGMTHLRILHPCYKFCKFEFVLCKYPLHLVVIGSEKYSFPINVSVRCIYISWLYVKVWWSENKKKKNVENDFCSHIHLILIEYRNPWKLILRWYILFISNSCCDIMHSEFNYTDIMHSEFNYTEGFCVWERWYKSEKYYYWFPAYHTYPQTLMKLI